MAFSRVFCSGNGLKSHYFLRGRRLAQQQDYSFGVQTELR